MKIAIDCRMLGKTGIGVFLKGLLDNLPKINNYLLVGDFNKLSIYRNNNTKIFDTNINPFSIKELFNFPTKEINAYDCLICPNYNIPSRVSIPIHTVIHDVLILDLKDTAGSYMGYLIRKYFILRALRISAKIYTVSNFSRKRIKKNTKYKKDIIVIYNGLSKGFLNKISMEGIKREAENISYCLYVGNLKRHKNLSTLIKAFIISKQKGYKGKLVLVGTFKGLRTKDTVIKKIINDSEYCNSIVFREKISNDELFNIVKNAELLIQPSLYEGFGIPPLEALSCGTPVALSNIPVFKEIYSDFPVEVFDSMDVNRLSEIILQKKTPVNVKNIKQLIDYHGYNFSSTVEKLFGTLD